MKEVIVCIVGFCVFISIILFGITYVEKESHNFQIRCVELGGTVDRGVCNK